MWNWFATDTTTVLGVVFSSICIYAAIIAYVRLIGLRSLSKMTAPDFAMTVAVGSLFGASISSPSPSVFTALVAFGMLFAGQKAISRLRVSDVPAGWIQNEPVLLAVDGELRHDAMQQCGVTEADVRAKLREANAPGLASVQAIVFESTGDVSVMHGGDEIDPWVMEGVVGYEC